MPLIIQNLTRNVVRNGSKMFSTRVRDVQEVRIPVPWGHVGGKWWGSKDQKPILCIHGWQDNCGTFNRLIPFLNDNASFLTIDLPGHGYSSRIPSGMYNHFTNYIILLRYIAKYFQWPSTSLMGHSLGGITSYVYTMIFPHEVDFAICIDGAKPMIGKNNVQRMEKAIDRFLKYDGFERSEIEPPSYTMEEIKQKVCKPNDNSIHYEHCHHIVERNIAPSKIYPGKYYFTRDPRVKTGELMNWSQVELAEGAQRITCPIFICKAAQGSYYEAKENFYEVLDVIKKHSRDCDFHKIDGTHHIHLNTPEELSKLINNFLTKHHKIEQNTVNVFMSVG